MPSVSFVVARSFPDGVIGYKNKLPWHLRSDLMNFRKITTGHVIIMGRKTHVSIGRTLPNRTNIVMTKNWQGMNDYSVNVEADTQLIFTNNYEDTLFFADVISICKGKKDIFVIGGETMYELFGDSVNKVYLTEVSAEVRGDAYFRMEFEKRVWKIIEEQTGPKLEGYDDFPFMYRVIERRDRKYRYNHFRRFMTDLSDKQRLLDLNIDKHKREIHQYFNENLELEL